MASFSGFLDLCFPPRRFAPAILDYGDPALRLRAGLSRLLLPAGQRRGRPRHAAARRPRPSRHARIPVRKSRRNIWSANIPRPPALSAKAHRRERRRPLRAHLLGRSARHHRRTADRRSRRSSGPRRFCPTATPAPWGCSTAPAWTAASSIAWARRAWTAPSAPRPAAPALTATLGLRYGTEPEQFRHSKLIIAWGANIHGTNVHLWPFIVEARRNGAKLIRDRSRHDPHRRAGRPASSRSIPAAIWRWRWA